MLNIEYSTKPDYSSLNPPKFVKILKIYNTILIPIDQINNNISPSDTVSFSYNKKIIKQKVGLDCGIVEFYNKKYYYFYLVPGFSAGPPDAIIINDESIKLNKYFDPKYQAKIINGLLVLDKNFNYLFNHTNYSIVLSNNKNILTNILKHESKYNYYTANTNNTILHILNPINKDAIYELNNTYNDIYIRPLFSKNYPLGQCLITAEGVSNIRIKIGNNIFKFNKTINIDHLPSGDYNIVFLDNNNNTIDISTLNDKPWNNSSFNLKIDKILSAKKTQSSLIESNQFGKPKKNFSNLLINLYPYNTGFEIIGPNNFYKKFDTGYQKLENIEPGIYNIKFRNTDKEVLVIKNDNNYFSNL